MPAVNVFPASAKPSELRPRDEPYNVATIKEMCRHLPKDKVEALLTDAEKNLEPEGAIAQCSGPLGNGDELFNRLWHSLIARRSSLFPWFRAHPEALLYARGPELACDYYQAQGVLKPVDMDRPAEIANWASFLMLITANGFEMPPVTAPLEGWLLPKRIGIFRRKCALREYLIAHGWESLGFWPNQDCDRHDQVVLTDWPKLEAVTTETNNLATNTLYHQIQSELSVAADEGPVGYLLFNPLKAAVVSAASHLLARTVVAQHFMADLEDFPVAIFPYGPCSLPASECSHGFLDREVLALLSLWPQYRPSDISDLWFFAIAAADCQDNASLIDLLESMNLTLNRLLSGYGEVEHDYDWWLWYFTHPGTQLEVEWAYGTIWRTLGIRLHCEDAPALVSPLGNESWYIRGEKTEAPPLDNRRRLEVALRAVRDSD